MIRKGSIISLSFIANGRLLRLIGVLGILVLTASWTLVGEASTPTSATTVAKPATVPAPAEDDTTASDTVSPTGLGSTLPPASAPTENQETTKPQALTLATPPPTAAASPTPSPTPTPPTPVAQPAITDATSATVVPVTSTMPTPAITTEAAPLASPQPSVPSPAPPAPTTIRPETTSAILTSTATKPISPSSPPEPPITPKPAPATLSPRVQAALTWAQIELHSADPSWSNQLRAPWSGYCEAFVEIAYGTRHRYASAIANYRAQAAAGLIHTDTAPPAGALVFYGGGIYGHVALSAGNGQVITTWGELGQRHAIRQVDIKAFSNPYLGWGLAPF